MPFGISTAVQNFSNLYGTGKKLKEIDRNNANQDYLMREREGIQARVEGAKAAGLHPLAALGFQSGSSPSIPVGTDVAPGSFSGAFKGKGPQVDQEMRNAQIRLMNAQAANYETEAMQRSTQRLATQPGNPPAYPTDPDNLTQGQGSNINGVRVKPNEIVSSFNGTEVGTQPTLATGRGSDGRKWHGLSEWGLKQTEDMELLRLGLFGYLNRLNILDEIGFNDKRMKYRLWEQDRAQKKETKLDNTRELIRLLNRSRAADRQR